MGSVVPRASRYQGFALLAGAPGQPVAVGLTQSRWLPGVPRARQAFDGLPGRVTGSRRELPGVPAAVGCTPRGLTGVCAWPQDIPTGADSCVTSLSCDSHRSLIVAGLGDGSIRVYDRRMALSEW